MLTVGDLPLTSSDLLFDLLADEHIASANLSFLQQQPTQISRECKSLVVLQGEQASVDFGAEDCWVGSEDATTCVIIALRCPATKRAWIAHYDEPLADGDADSLLDALAQLQYPEVYLVGGFREDSGVSLSVCRRVLQILHAADQKVEVKLACLYSSNTDTTTGVPLTRQLALQCSTGLALPACFEDRGPELPRRMAYPHCSRSRRLLCIHSHEQGLLQLPGFDSKLPSWYVMRLESMLEFDDEAFLRMNSTSPDHEGPSFLPDIRAAYQWIVDAQDKPDPGPATYHWQAGASGWVLQRVAAVQHAVVQNG